MMLILHQTHIEYCFCNATGCEEEASEASVGEDEDSDAFQIQRGCESRQRKNSPGALMIKLRAHDSIHRVG